MIRVKKPVPAVTAPLTAKQIRFRTMMKERQNIKAAANSRKALLDALVQTGSLSAESTPGMNLKLQKDLKPIIGATIRGKKGLALRHSLDLATGFLRRRNSRIDYEINIRPPDMRDVSYPDLKVLARVFKCDKRGNKKKLLVETHVVGPAAIKLKLHPEFYLIELKPDNSFMWANLSKKFRVEKVVDTTTFTLKSKWAQAVCERLTQDSDLMILGYIAKRLPQLPQSTLLFALIGNSKNIYSNPNQPIMESFY